MIKSALLVLEDGTQFHGRAIGATGSAVGEVVFNTSMTGYQEILTDPSYSRQIVTLTYPHIGNVGTNDADEESSQVHAQGLVIRDLPLIASNFRNTEDLSSYLKRHNIVAIADIDTRKLTRLLREKGAQNGCIIAGDNPDAALALEKARAFPGLNGMDLAKEVTTAEAYSWTQGSWTLTGGLPEAKKEDELPFHVVAYDFGAKRNILRMLVDRGCRLTIVPAQTSAEDVLKMNPDGIFLSNGPGDPAPCDYAITAIQKFLETDIPVFGICLGHQLLALLYIQEKKYDLAKKSLRNAGKIDANNTTTLRYLKEVNAGLRENNPKKQKNEDLISYQSGNETIIQPRYLKDNSAIGTIINMVIGIAIGAAITCFLIVPGVRREIQNQAKAEVLDANNAVASKNQSISSLEAQIEDLTSQITDAKNEEESSAGKVNTYEQLLQAYVAYTDGDIEKAGTALGNVNTDYLSDDSMTVYDTINAQVNAEYISAVYKEATDAYNAQEFTQAIEDYLKVIELDETYDNGNALYYLAQSYRRNDDMDNAKTYYQKFADLYPGTERAANAQRYLNTEE